MRPKQFNALPDRVKWEKWGGLKGRYKWYCPGCKSPLHEPHRASPFSGASIHCVNCDFELTRRTNGGQCDPFGWHLGKIQPPKFDELPNGTVIRRGKRLYSLQQGLEQRLIVDVDTGIWQFAEELRWKSYDVAYKPYKRK